NGLVRVTGDGRRLDARVAADFVDVGTLRADLALPAYSAGAAPEREPIEGTVALHLKDLSLAQGLSRDLDATGGKLDADLTIGGTVAYPSVRGPLRIANGVADVPTLGLQLREIHVEATGSSGGKLALTGSLRSGSGVLKIDGTAALGAGIKPQARLALSGD